jgi:hypothetical protein
MLYTTRKFLLDFGGSLLEWNFSFMKGRHFEKKMLALGEHFGKQNVHSWWMFRKVK